MITPRLVPVILVAAIAAGAQQPPGQPPTKELAITYKNMEKDPILGWQLSKPFSENQVGVWSPTGPNLPGGILPTSSGLLEFTMPTGQFWTIGIEITQFLYEDSTGPEFANFGPLETPVLLPPSHYPLDYPPGAKMWQHLSDQTMWAFVSGPPTQHASWTTAFPPVSGPGPMVTIEPLGGPGNFFSQIMSALPSVAIPPSMSPGGGGLIGMNVILQMAVLENDPLPPDPARYMTSNSWGLQAMAGPVLKLNAGAGGNFGPSGSTRHVTADFPNVGVQVELDSLDGTRIDVPTSIVDGRTIAYTPPGQAKSGALEVRSPTGEVMYVRPLIDIITHGVPVDIAVDSPTPVIRLVDGVPVFGFSLVHTATSTPTVINFPDVPAGVVYDLEAKFYAFNRNDNVAGFDDGNAANASIPIEIAVTPEGQQAPPAVQIPTPAVPIGNGGSVRVHTFTGLTGGQDIIVETPSTVASFDFLLVLRAYPSGALNETP